MVIGSQAARRSDVRKTRITSLSSRVTLALALGCRQHRALAAQARQERRQSAGKGDIRIVTLDPGHFHAALPHRESYPDVDARVHVYAPLGTDLIEHLKRIVALQPAPREPHRLAAGDAHRAGLPRALQARRGRATWWSSPAATGARSTTSRPAVGAGLPRPGRQALDPAVGGSAQAEGDAGPGREEGAHRLRHDDRALRDHDPAAEGAGQRSRGLRQGRPGHARAAQRLHGERAPPDEDGGGRAQHPPGLVLRQGAAGRGGQRHRHPPGGSGALDAVAGAGDRRREGDPDPVGPALADPDQPGQLPAGDRREGLPGSSSRRT